MLRELKRYGIKDLPHDLSLSLGSISLSPLALAHYYTSFANHGIQVEPQLIRTVSNGYGSVKKYETREKFITTPQQTYLMTTILHDVVRRGTGRRAAVPGIEIAGKTGTTNKSIDAWFAGYTPTVETVVWFGNDDNTPMLKRETGGRVAGPAFAYYVNELLRLYPQIKRHFEQPDGIITTTVKGKNEYFSDVSKAPLIERDHDQSDSLIF